MLRQALHDAEEAGAALLQRQEAPRPSEGPGQQQQQQQQPTPPTPSGGRYGSVGSSSATATEEGRSAYGDEQGDAGGEEGSDEGEEEEEEDDEEEEDEDDENEDAEDDEPLPWYRRAWEAAKSGVRIVANVENLWDESVTPPESASDSFRSGGGSGGAGASAPGAFPPGNVPSSQSLFPHAPAPSGDDASLLLLPHERLLRPLREQPRRGRRDDGDGEGEDEGVLGRQRRLRIRTRNTIVFFWFVVLASSYASERSTFKLLVDRAGPFRLFAVEAVTLGHAALLAAGIAASRLARSGSGGAVHRSGRASANAVWSSSSPSALPALSLGISVVDVALMALLESVQLVVAFLTGLHVPPTLTVILIQFTLPLTAFLTQFVHPEGRCRCVAAAPGAADAPSTVSGGGAAATPPPPPPAQGPHGDPLGGHRHRGFQSEELLHREDHRGRNLSPPGRAGGRRRAGEVLDRCGGLTMEHVWGSLIIFLAVLLALIPAFVAIARPEFFDYADTIPIRTAFNTLLYVSSCIPAAAAQLYKEHVFLQYKQPVNMTTLNLLLSVFEFGFCSVLAPLVFGLQGLGAPGRWEGLYPASMFSDNFWDGLRCFFRMLPAEDQQNKYYDDARCDFALGLVLVHVFSIAAVGVAVDKIVNAGATKVMYRGMSAGIVLAVLCMHAYDMRIVEFSYGAAVDGLNLACLILLILGSEVYHRVALKDLTFDTVYQPIHIEGMYDA